MNISLIGMSGIGKSFWSKRLAGTGDFTRLDCDGEIEASLASTLSPFGGDMGKWMGQPFDPDFKSRESQYLKLEQQVMLDAISRLESAKPGSRFVVDASGSVIYSDPKLLDRLRALTHVVFLHAHDRYIQEMFSRYLRRPRPVIWNDHFNPKTGENRDETLKRCYKELLESRNQKYEQLAHQRLDYERHRNHNMEATEFLSMIRT